jgi:hypothetical protein
MSDGKKRKPRAKFEWESFLADGPEMAHDLGVSLEQFHLMTKWPGAPGKILIWKRCVRHVRQEWRDFLLAERAEANRVDSGVLVVRSEVRVTPRATDLRVDWRRIVADLRAHHGTLQAVADLTGIQRRTLGMTVARYSEPRYLDGRALIVAWCEVTGGDEASPPMIRLSEICEP